MPVEGQWNRVINPLPARDRRVLAIGACALVVAGAGGLVAALTQHSESNAGCVIVTVASTTGGAVLRSCGADARTFCREESNLGNAAEQCRRLGYPLRPAAVGA